MNSLYKEWADGDFEKAIFKVADRKDYLLNIKHGFNEEQFYNKVFYIWEAQFLISF